MKIMYEAVATAKGGRNGQVKSSDGVLNIEVRTPKGLGGPGGAYTNPEQLFAAGYSACFDSALNHVAKLKRIPVKDTQVTATVGIGQLVSGGFGLEVKLEVKIPDLEKELSEELLQAAHMACPYSNATRGNVKVELCLVD
ncbi:organic hydroperoxide resistance protein [Lutibacter sp. B1]|jgi:Ohr subfamily peroxiredoxin|uniref:organic hydroperoxide resistance protein n=1 Tax=Lutibacter sp. B1 TaxID=2725996 RepID=UPI00145762A8|nr:organic hydroperoxide resistance protein [Lutibacter sp. B1]NLP56911.1 organic hydroperoxide resistance protein [Lutibacter sp. B1]